MEMTLTLIRSLACRLITSDDDLTLPHIVVQCHSQTCTSCGATHRWSETYECITKGKIKHYLPARIPSDIPSDYFIAPVTMPPRRVIVCHECVGSGARDSDAHSRWAETLRHKSSEEGASSAGAGPAVRRTVTPDML